MKLRVTNGPQHPLEALLDKADESPDQGEGSLWHLRNEYAWALGQDWRDCVECGDHDGARDCVLDAMDTLRAWIRFDRASNTEEYLDKVYGPREIP